MSVDITTLSIRVESVGIKQAANDLEALSRAASSVEVKAGAVKSALSGLSASQANQATAIEKMLGKMQKQVDLMGANVSQTNAYNLSQKNASELHKQMGNMLGAEVDAYKRLTAHQAEAIKMNDAYNRSAQAGRNLNLAGGRAEEYRKLGLAQAEAIRMNNALDASTRRNSADQAAAQQRRLTEAMREGHSAARGLSGSLGALWLTYGNIAGMAIGVGIGAALKGVVTVGKDVEHVLEGIRVRGQETTKAIDEMRQSIFDLGKGVYGPQQVAQAFETLILAGLKADQAMVSVNAAMNLALVGGTTIEKAAQTLVSVGTAVGYTAEGFDRVGDVIAKTAALSMSSVATLSEAFKSGSSVNKLYGVSLEDIGTNLGVLSNLGIQGSAAGTAMKNFYKELAGGSEKVTGTLKSMKLTSESFKNSRGDFLPLLDVVSVLDGGLKNLTESQQKLAIANLTNERGMRLAVQLLGEYNTKTGESSNALIEFRKNVENSYGFAAIGAVAMSLTAKSQIDSMVNTLKTTFAEVFTEMQPEIIAFTGQMKSIFASDSFKSGIMFLAQSFANLAVAIADNLPLITKLILGFTAIKVLIAGGAMWTAAVAGVTSLTVAMRALTAGTLTFGAALGPLTLLIAGLTAAYILYNNAMGDSNKNTKMATDYSKGYLAGLTEEANRLDKVNAKLKEKMSLSEANERIARGEAKDKMVELNNKAIAEAKDKLDNGVKWTGYTKIAQAQELERLRLKAKTDLEAVDKIEKRIFDRAKENADIVKANSNANRERPSGEGTLGGKPNKAAINDAYGATMIEQASTIKSARKELQAFEDQMNTRFRAGEIGKIQFIEEVQAKQVATYAKTQDALKQQMAFAKSKGSDSDMARVKGDMNQAQEDFEAKTAQSRIEKEAAVSKAVEDFVKLRIIKLEEEGNYAQAAQMRWSAEHGAAYKQAQKDAEAYGAVYPVLIDRVNELGAVQKAAIKNGLDRESVNDFNVAAEATRNAMKGIQTATEGQGLAAMFDAATAASARYAADLPALKEKMGAITDPSKLNEAQAELTRLAETQRKMWAGVGESISTSLENAFGNGGRAMGDLIKVGIKFKNQEDKSSSARIKAYGDAAGAAKGFFKENTTGYKIMEGAEKAFRAVELVGMVQSLAATASTEAAKNTLKIPGVIMSFMSMLGPWGLAAAGVAIAAVLGGAFGGGGGGESAASRQKSAGSGSVLGDSDAKSASITNSLEILEKNSGLGLVHSNEMVKSLNIIANSISGLASLVVRTTGIKDGATSGVQEGYSMSSVGKFGAPATGYDKIVAKLFGTKTSIIDQGIKIGSNTLSGIDSVGVQAQSYADIERKKKLFGMTTSTKVSTATGNVPQEINDQFTLVIKNLANGVAAAADSLGLGGDAFTEKMKTFIVDIGSISIKDMTGEEIQEQFQAIFSKLGDDMAKFGVDGLDKFQKVGEGYFETLARVANDLVQVKDVFAVLGKSLNLTGMQAIDVSESLIAAAGGLEKLTDGTKFFVDNFLTEAERMAPITASVTKRLSELGQSELTSVELYKKKILALDLTNAADQQLYASLIALAPAFNEVSEYAKNATKLSDEASKQRELEIRIMEAQGFATMATAERRKDELAALNRLNPALGVLQTKLWGIEDAQAFLDGKVKDSKSALTDAYQRESKVLQEVVDKFKKLSESLRKLKDTLAMGELSTLSPEQKYLKSKSDFESLSAKASSGDVDALTQLEEASKSFLDISRAYNASTEAYSKDYDLVQRALANGVAASDYALSTAQAQLTVMKSQYETLVGIEKGVVSFKDALAGYVADMNAAKNPMAGGVTNIGQAYQTYLGRDAEKDGLDFWTKALANGTDVIAGIANSAEAQINAVYRSALGRNAEGAGMEFYLKALKDGLSMDAITKNISQSEEAMKYAVHGSHYDGLDSVPFDGYTAKLHQGERVQTAKAANASDKNSAELVVLTKELLAKIANMDANTEASIAQRAAIAAEAAKQADAAKQLIEKQNRVVARS